KATRDRGVRPEGRRRCARGRTRDRPQPRAQGGLRARHSTPPSVRWSRDSRGSPQRSLSPRAYPGEATEPTSRTGTNGPTAKGSGWASNVERALDPHHVKLADQVAEDDRAVAGHSEAQPITAGRGEDAAGLLGRQTRPPPPPSPLSAKHRPLRT